MLLVYIYIFLRKPNSEYICRVVRRIILFLLRKSTNVTVTLIFVLIDLRDNEGFPYSKFLLITNKNLSTVIFYVTALNKKQFMVIFLFLFDIMWRGEPVLRLVVSHTRTLRPVKWSKRVPMTVAIHITLQLQCYTYSTIWFLIILY